MSTASLRPLKDDDYRTWLPLLMIGFPGLLFAVKYGPRAGISPSLSVVAYLVFYVVHIAGALWISKRIGDLPRSWALLGGGVLLYLLGLLVVYSRIDPLALQIDRWSALTYFWDSIFRAEYPYDARTHLGSPISGFPVLFGIALPFYLLGDVGLMQFAAFVGFAALAWRLFRKPGPIAFVLILLAGLPTFVYEVLARSELFSNMLVAAALLYAGTFTETRRGRVPLLALAAAWGLMMSTRGVLIAPFLLAVFPLLQGRSWSEKVSFGAVFGMVCAATFLPLYAWDPARFIDGNPYLVQSSYIPGWALFLVLTAALVTGYRHRKSPSLFAHAGGILFATVLGCWLLALSQKGWHTVIWGHGFDLTYFTLPLPFLLLTVGLARTRAVPVSAG